MVVLGIDPGYAIVGWGVISFNGVSYAPLGFGAVTTNAGTDFNRRLEHIYDELDLIIKQAKPDAMAIEKLYFQNNQKTAINVAQARGVITLSAQNYGVDIFEYTPLQVKQSVVGYGRAEKKQVQEMTRVMLGLEKIPKPDDTADALAMAICHGHCSGSIMGSLSGLR
ncbi:MAG TPA: crossover junction endodeoxyribonuclease RuvC [Ruminococcaceae bacterium]|nr:crossover junction endodeoxyribonuclease RuvC [Oscillospiraceae bacterium]